MKTKARTSSSFFRLCILLVCISGMAWTCRTLSGHKVQGYTFEEAVHLLQQGHANPRIVCAELRDRIVEAVKVLRAAGPDGALAVEAIHKESR